MNWNAKWIAAREEMGEVCPVFERSFTGKEGLVSAVLSVTAMGVYEVELNGSRVSEYVLAPGWTAYEKRHQYQQYDVTGLLQGDNTLRILAGRGWYGSRMFVKLRAEKGPVPLGVIAQLELTYEDGSKEILGTDESWCVRESMVRFSDIYDGETADGQFTFGPEQPVAALDKGVENLIPQEGEIIREQDRVMPRRIFTTPKGETVVDFGQEVTGYVEFTVTGQAGDRVEISHAEVLDKDGNFYTENYRSAKAKLRYTCREGVQTYKPRLTFFGFRYIRLDQFPGQPKPEDFTAILVSSDLKRTGSLRCGVPMVNRLFENIFWGQRDNFLDIPTDCPQRDERLGWTGDAQVFCKTASYNYQVQKFFRKWLGDLAAEQLENGAVTHIVPATWGQDGASAAWGDACVIIPWQMYLTYGDVEVLARQYDSICKFVDYITNATTTQYLWTGGTHFGDWLGLDAPSGSYKGSSRDDLIASAFYAHDTLLLVKISKLLGKDASRYEALYENIVKTFRSCFTEYKTQTECVVALHFDLAADPEATAAQLAQMVRSAGPALQTGFVGTPYILYTLSKYGYTELAYDLVLRQEYPGWLYCVNKGATTIWEHWDGLMVDGGFWSADMNSFNHYAYGSVAGWIYEEAAGIHPVEEAPGFRKVVFAPNPDPRLGWLEASIDTAYGTVRSGWYYETEGLRFEISTPVEAVFRWKGKQYDLRPGTHLFFD